MCSAYSKIKEIPGYSFEHLTVNHSENLDFVNPSTVHTQQTKRNWNVLKRLNKRHYGTLAQMIDSYLCEFMWRRRHDGEDLFEAILKIIANFKDDLWS